MKTLISYSREKLKANDQILRSVGALFGTNIMSAICAAFGGLLVAKFVGPDEAGLFRAYTIPLMYLNVLHLGTPDGLLRQLPYYRGKGSTDRVLTLASSAATWNLLVSVVLSAVFLGIAFTSLAKSDFVGFFGWGAQAVVSWGTFYSIYLSATYRALGKFTLVANVEFKQALGSLLLVALLPLTRFYGLCVRSALPSLVALYSLHRHRPLRVQFRLRFADLREVVSTGFPFFFWIYLSTPLWIATENFLVLHIGGTEALGFLGVAIIMREGMGLLPQSIHQVLMPKMVEKFAIENDIHKINRKLRLATVVTALVMIVASIIIWKLLQVVVPILLPRYLGGMRIFEISLAFPILQALALPLNTLFASGQSWLYGRGVLFGIVIFGLSAFLMLYQGGDAASVLWASLFGRTARILVTYHDIWQMLADTKLLSNAGQNRHGSSLES